MKKKFLVKITQIAFFILLTGGLFIFVSQCNPRLFNYIMQAINDHAKFFRVMRWSMILFLAFSWRYFVKKISHEYEISEEKIAYWQSKIIQIIGWLILFELLICENIILEFIHHFRG